MEQFKEQLLLFDNNFILTSGIPDKWNTIYNEVNNVYIDFDILSDVESFISIYNEIKKYKLEKDLQIILYNEANTLFTCIVFNNNLNNIISIKTKTDLTLDVYRQFKEYIELNKEYNFNCHIDMTDINNIAVSQSDEDNIKITINNNSIQTIITIYKKLWKYNTILEINVSFINNCIGNIILKYENEIIEATNYNELIEKIEEYLRKQILESTNLIKPLDYIIKILKLKYGNELIYNINNNIENSLLIDFTISDVQIEYIDLFDIIPFYKGDIINNGFIKKGNYFDIDQIQNKLKYIDYNNYIINIIIENCKNLKIINNVIHFQNKSCLRIFNCPKLEFIQNYNNFTDIYINNHLINVISQ